MIRKVECCTEVNSFETKAYIISNFFSKIDKYYVQGDLKFLNRFFQDMYRAYRIRSLSAA